MKPLIADGIESKCYFITDNGDIFNVEGKKMKPSMAKGYVRVRLCRDLPRRMYMVHRLLAENYIPNPYNLPYINHIDGDRANNSLSNLEWCDNSHNQLHRYRVLGWEGTRKRPVEQLTLDGQIVQTWKSASDAEMGTGVTSQNIWKVCNGRRAVAGGFSWRYK